MKYDDVRGACLGLIKTRLHGSAGRATQAAALGWQLENSDVEAGELASLCAAWLSDPQAPTASPMHWQPSPLLRAFFTEYRRVRQDGLAKHAPRPRSHADRRPIGTPPS